VPERTAGRGARRRDLVSSLLAGLGTDRRWAWQGDETAVDSWADRDDHADLDLWCPEESLPRMRSLLASWPAGVVADAGDARRLRHLSVAAETDQGLAVVDVTYGDLRVGPVLLLAEADVTSEAGRLTGVAAAADNALRPLLRGRVPADRRLDLARKGWALAAPDQRTRAATLWADSLGRDVASAVVGCLEGAAPDADLPRSCRRALLRRTLAPTAWGTTWAQRHAILPAGRSAGPAGLRRRGVVVVLVGTDGSGKSTVASDLATRLERLGFATSSAYFGMARGNLPGVGLARRLLGVAEVPADVGESAAVTTEPIDDGVEAPLSHPQLRRIAAWYYAGEYAFRFASRVAPRVRRREVVICDRYVYDLRESPWPGSLASKVAERIVPRPDVLVLPDAPVELIHARKPERTLADQTAQQGRFRDLLASRPARVSDIRVDTSGADPDGVADVVAAVVTAAHRPRGRARD
jgi:thymidylate kinase